MKKLLIVVVIIATMTHSFIPRAVDARSWSVCSIAHLAPWAGAACAVQILMDHWVWTSQHPGGPGDGDDPGA